MTKDLLIVFWCIVLAGLAGLAATLLQPNNSKRNAALPVIEIQKAITSVSLNPATSEYKSAVLYDAQSGKMLFSKDSERQLPLASLTKLAAALAVLSQGEDRFITIHEEDLAPEGDSGLHAGDVWRLGDLVAFSLTSSSNDGMQAAAQVLTEEGTISKMNTAAALEGFSQSYFLNPTGLDVTPSTAGAYGSALDVAHMVEELLKKHGGVFTATTKAPIPNGNSGRGNTSTLEPLWDIPGLIAAKTGYTTLAGGNLAAAIDLGLGQPVIAVVLGSTQEGRFEDVRKMITAAREAQINQ